jgi:hypothetical protein
MNVLWSSRHFKQYIYGQKMTVFTDHDHKPLADLRNNRKLEEPLGRLMIKQGLNYNIRYVRGVDNTVADLLSRDVNSEEENINTIDIESNDWPTEQRADRDTSHVIENLKQNKSQIIETLKLDGNRPLDVVEPGHIADLNSSLLEY